MKYRQYQYGLAVLLLVSGSAYAQLYRCESDGTTTFSDIPCPAGVTGERTRDTGNAGPSGNASSAIIVQQEPDYKRKAKAADMYIRIQAIDRQISAKEAQIAQNIHAMEAE